MMSYSNPSYTSTWYPAYPSYGYSYYGYPENYAAWTQDYQQPARPAHKKESTPPPEPEPLPVAEHQKTAIRPVVSPKNQPQFEFVAWDRWKDTALRYLGYLKEIADSWEKPLQYYYGKNTGRMYFKAARLIDWGYSASYITKNTVEAYNFPGIKSKPAKLWFASAIAGDSLLFQFFSNVFVPEVASRVTKRLVRKGLDLVFSQMRRTPQFKHARILLPALASTGVMFSLSVLDPFINAAIHGALWPVINPLLKGVGAPTLSEADMPETYKQKFDTANNPPNPLIRSLESASENLKYTPLNRLRIPPSQYTY